MLAYHYTDALRLSQIMESGRLVPGADSGRPWNISAVWFTCAADPDEGNHRLYTHRLSGSKYTMTANEKAHTIGLGRVAVEADSLLTMPQACKAGILSAEGLDEYSAAARFLGADPDLWRITPHAVPCERWEAVELFEGGEWRPAEDAMHGAMARLDRFLMFYEAMVAPMIARGPCLNPAPAGPADGQASAQRESSPA